MEKNKLHKLLLRQINKICTNPEDSFENNEDFRKFLESISKTYEEYDEHSYTLERSLELSFEELEILQKEQKNSYEARLKAIVGAMPDMMFLNDEEGIFLEVFAKKEDDLYASKATMIGKKYSEIFPDELASFFKKSLAKALKTNELTIVEYELTSNNEIEYYEVRLISTGHLANDKQTVISIVRNISVEKRSQQRLEYIATYDDLTKLPNRFYFQKKLKKILKDAKKRNKQGGLFVFDLDQFKVVNDNLGHDIGDKILLKVSKRLKKIMAKEDFLARFGGDEFVLIVQNSSEKELAKIAALIQEQFITPFNVEKYSLEITASIGVCVFPDMIDTSNQLLKQADIAMYDAKASGRNRCRFFTQALSEKVHEEFVLETKLKKAIDNHEFFLMYQPQVQLKDNKLVGVEALLRWECCGLIPPFKFIPLAEKCGYIEHISDWVIKETCLQINKWKDEDIKVPRVAINLSRQELGKKNLLRRITTIINTYKVDFKFIEFEVTETALFQNTLVALENIKALRSRGFVVSIDDFGTGYSSLSNINESLFDKLKIDRSFIMGIDVKKESESIIKATIAMAKSLNLKVIAEGVETCEQLAFLKKHNCDEVQGYYYSRPILAEEVVGFIKGV